MSGIYIHIPFCKQACHYCDFHFSTSMSKKEAMVLALAKEMELRKNEAKNSEIETIYFGGGTPSVLTTDEINFLINQVYKFFKVAENPEITLEANPDDLAETKIIQLSKTKINRLSIGIQSFFEDDLKMMNRVHNSSEAIESLRIARTFFDNISIDLIYGIPGMSNKKWLQNIEMALSFNIPHISSYSLTVEPKTALDKFIKNGILQKPDDEVAAQHFQILVNKLSENGFIHYELSNFGKENYFSKNNSGYWLGNKYIGIGPSAHSFSGDSRSWNISNNSIYIKTISENKLPSETEVLLETDKYNEYIMTGLRTIWGISLEKIENEFGNQFYKHLQKQSQKYIADGLLYIENNILKPTEKGIFLCDGIASDLFLLNLE
jgi:oxygen-independent coproporphyrinogen III oxidase